MAHHKPPTFTGELSKEIDDAYEAYKAGEPFSSNRLHRAFREQARNIAWHWFGLQDEHLPVDIATRAMLRLDTFQGRSKLSTWFYRLAQNEVKRALRRHVTDRQTNVRIGSVDEQDVIRPPVDLEAKPVSQDDSLDIAKLRQGLPKEQDEVLRLNMEGYSLEQIATMKGIALGTIRSRYRLAKEKMGKRGRASE